MSKKAARKKVKKLGMARVAKMPEDPRPRRVVQAEIDEALFDEVKAHIDQRGVHIREVIIWAFESYLLSYMPSKAARLGIESA